MDCRTLLLHSCSVMLPPMIIDHQSLLPLLTDDRKEFLKSAYRKNLFLTFYFKRQVVKKLNTKLFVLVILDFMSVKGKKCDKIACYKTLLQPRSTDIFLISPLKHTMW